MGEGHQDTGENPMAQYQTLRVWQPSQARFAGRSR